MKNSILLWELIALFMVLGSCSKLNKKETASGATRVNIQLLLKYQWVIASQKAAYLEKGHLKSYTLPKPDFCQRDDVYKFFDDGRFIIHEGKKSCIKPPPETNEPLIVNTGSWAYALDTLSIHLSEGDVLNYRIEALTPTRLVLTKKVIFPNGLEGTVKQIFRTVEKKNTKIAHKRTEQAYSL